MSTSAMKILCRYQYDPLDRLTGLKPAEHVGTQRFYQNDELVNEIESQVELTILRHEAQPLAQRLHIANVTETTLLATDQQRSVLQTLAGVDTQRMAYTAYGHRPAESGLSSLLGFNGERPDPVTGHYLLGQGNRAFNTVLIRLNSPDELSPFGDGGINAYAYCGGDPVNRYDPSGNNALFRLWDNLINPEKQLKALNLSSKAISRNARPKSPWRPWEGTVPQANKNLKQKKFQQKPSDASSSTAYTAAPSESIKTTENSVSTLPPETLQLKGYNPALPLTEQTWAQRASFKAYEYDKLAAANKISVNPDPNYIKEYLSANTEILKRNARWFAKMNVMDKMELAQKTKIIRN